MNIIAIAFTVFSKRSHPLRNAASSTVAPLAVLLTMILTPLSGNLYGQESINEMRDSSLTPSRPKSSLRPLVIDKGSKKSEPSGFRLQPQLPTKEPAQTEIEAIRQIRKQIGGTGLNELFDNPQEADRQFTEELERLIQHQAAEPHQQQSQLSPLRPRQPRQIRENPLRPLLDVPGQQVPGQQVPGQQVESLQRSTMENEPLPDERVELNSEFPNSTTGPLQPTPESLRHPRRNQLRVANPFSLHPAPANPHLRGKITSARAIASKLEQAAAELESLQLYDDADTVRAAAQGIWRRARSLETDEWAQERTRNLER